MAAGGVTVGSVWLDVMPSMRNFGSTLVDGVEKETKAGGTRAGESLGDNTEKGFKGKLGAITAVGATIGVGVAAALTQAMDLEQSRAKLAAQLGLSSEEAQLFGKVAGDLYSQAYGDSMDQVNEAIVNVSRNIGGLNDADLSAVSGTVLNLANTFGVDLQGATAAVGTAIKSGLAPDAKTALDFITAGFQGGVDKAGDFLDTITEYGVQFQKLGLDGQVATGLLSQGLEAGARSADLVADSIKEFSIRAVDGSKTTAAGFQAIGLDARTMAAQIAQGGPAAQAGLDMVLDRLRAMPDPVARSQAAVALFGTQAEDLGEALYALDPSSAVDALGGVAGAAQAMNDTLNETAASRLESFKRSLQTGLVDFLGGAVLPVLQTVSGFGATLFGEAWGPVKEFLGWLAGTGGVVVGVILAVAAAVNLWTWANNALNLSFLASPITWIVIGIVALVAAVIWAWHNFEGFRNVVLAVWSGIQTAASVAWSILSAIFTGIWSAIQFVGSVFVWLWSTAVSPVFNFIGMAARILFAILFTVLITPIILGIQLLGAIFSWLWSAVVSPVFGFIGAIATWLWVAVLAPVFGWIGAGLQVLGSFFSWLWSAAISPVFGFIAAGAQALWSGLGVVFGWIQSGLSAVGSFFGWVYNTLIKPAFDAWGAAGRMVWDNFLRPAFDAISAGVRAVGDAFNAAVGFIQAAWSRIEGIVRPPIAFVVNLAYNHGIRPAWNFIAGLFDLPELAPMTFARGGLVPGYSPGNDTVPAMLSPGEAVLVPEAVRLLGPQAVLALNAYAQRRSGKVPRPIASLMNPEGGDIGYPGDYPRRVGFAGGGIVGWIWDRVVDVGNFVGGVAEIIADPAGALRRVFETVVGGNGGAAGELGRAIAAFPVKAIDGVIEWMKSFVEENAPDGNYGAGLAWAKSQVGLPYTWGGSGNPGWDCSGFIAGITQVIRGRTPGRIGTTATMPWPGFVPGSGGLFTVGNSRNTGGGIGHMAGTLLGQNVESYGGHGPAVGAGARGSADGLFPEKYTFTYDDGGYLPPGWSSVYNGTGSPEPVLTGKQWDALASDEGDAEYVISSGWLDVREDGLVRLVDGRLRKVSTSLTNGRRA